MRFRFKAFGLHLLASACALSLVLGGLYLGWYHWPGWYLTAVGRILIIVCSVDLVLGPTLTLIIANPRKLRRTLARDIAIIASVQLVALIYGATTLWQGRPLYYTFSANRLETVQASDLDDEEIARAAKENPAFAPRWYSRPRWVWAPLPMIRTGRGHRPVNHVRGRSGRHRHATLFQAVGCRSRRRWRNS